jgi:hypothetical protein
MSFIYGKDYHYIDNSPKLIEIRDRGINWNKIPEGGIFKGCLTKLDKEAFDTDPDFVYWLLERCAVYGVAFDEDGLFELIGDYLCQ